MAVSVEKYILKHPKWDKELRELWKMFCATNLEENIKWGAPVFSLNGKNVVGMAAFKNHYALWFYQGALLKQNTALLENAQEGKTQALRQIKFRKGDKLDIPELKKYVLEAIKNETEGKRIKKQPVKEVEIPAELKLYFDKNKVLESAFFKLSPGKQREYSLYIAEAKMAKTKESRIKKSIPLILEGKGLHDKYKNC